VTVTPRHEDVTSERLFDDHFLRLLLSIQGWGTRSMSYPTMYVAAFTHPMHK